MYFEDLPKEMQEFIDGLKHHSSTIECDIGDAFEQGETIKEVVESTISKMEDLAGEANSVKEFFETYRE